MSKDKPAIVIDLDGTILRRQPLDWFRLYMSASSNIGIPFVQAFEVLIRLQEQFQIIAITARAERGKPNTRKWLEKLGLPDIELFHSPHMQLAESTRTKYKSSVIEALIAKGMDIRFGMGDRGSDFVAYAKNGVFPIVVLRPKQRGKLVRIRAIAASMGLKDIDWATFFEEPDSPCWPLIEQFVASKMDISLKLNK